MTTLRMTLESEMRKLIEKTTTVPPPTTKMKQPKPKKKMMMMTWKMMMPFVPNYSSSRTQLSSRHMTVTYTILSCIFNSGRACSLRNLQISCLTSFVVVFLNNLLPKVTFYGMNLNFVLIFDLFFSIKSFFLTKIMILIWVVK